MKRKLLLVLAILSVGVVNAQYYASVGAGVSNKTASYGAEVGTFTDKTWIGVGYDHVPSMNENYLSIRYYHKIFTDKKLDVFGYASSEMEVKSRNLFFRPGVSFVYNIKNVAPQFTITNVFDQKFKSQALNYSVNFNVFF